MINQAKKGIAILHPLPRVDEISTDVDDYEEAAYFSRPIMDSTIEWPF